MVSAAHKHESCLRFQGGQGLADVKCGADRLLMALLPCAGALLAVGVVNSGVADEVEPAFAILSGV